MNNFALSFLLLTTWTGSVVGVINTNQDKVANNLAVTDWTELQSSSPTIK